MGLVAVWAGELSLRVVLALVLRLVLLWHKVFREEVVWVEVFALVVRWSVVLAVVVLFWVRLFTGKLLPEERALEVLGEERWVAVLAFVFAVLRVLSAELLAVVLTVWVLAVLAHVFTIVLRRWVAGLVVVWVVGDAFDLWDDTAGLGLASGHNGEQ